MGDAIEIAKASRAKLVTVNFPALFEREQLPEELIVLVNVGGTVTLGDVTVHAVPAMHGSEPSGRPLGYVIDFPDRRAVYHQGDTWIFNDMALIQEFYHPNIILMGVGGGPFTMDPRQAQLAINKYFKPQAIVPMHYGTFEGLATATDVRVRFAGDRRVTVMTPGQKLYY
jgi:L-ascorbate metabolism protein UlaG (beta-lactamase superfamily)